MGVTALYSNQDAEEAPDYLASAASDGGICLSDDAPQTKNSTNTKPIDFEAHPEVGMAMSLILLDIYANPDPNLKNLITTPGGQKIWVYSQTVSCSEFETVASAKLLNDTLINGAWFLAGQKITFHENLAFDSGILRDDVEILPDIWLKDKTQASFAADETLTDNAHFESGILRDDEIFYGIKFPAGTEADFHPSGKFKKATLAQDTQINGIWFDKYHEVEFDDGGNLIRGFLRDPKEFNGITWQALAEVEFHPNKEFLGGTLAAMTPVKIPKIGDVTLIAGTRLEYHDNKKFAKINPLQDVRVSANGVTLLLRGTKEIELYKNGNLKSAVLRDPVTINGIDLAPGLISFFENGFIEKAILVHDTKIATLKVDVTFMGGHEIEFDEEGNFHGGDITENLVLKSYLDDSGKPIVIKAEKFTTFYADGTFRSGRLLKETVIDDLPLAEGSKIKFHEDKRLKSGILAGDTSIYDDVYNGDIVFAADTECGYNDKNELFGELKYDVSFDVELDGRELTLTAKAGRNIEFIHDTKKVSGGTLKDEVSVWQGVSFAADEWFEIDMSHSDYFETDTDDVEEDYIGGVLTKPLSRDGHELPANKFCKFYVDGSVLGYSVKDKFEVDEDLYPGLFMGESRWVEFYPGGKNISGGKLAADVEPFADIYTDRDNPFVFAQNSWVSFDEDGILTGGKLAFDFMMEHQVFGGIFLKAGEWVDVTPDGLILGGRLADDTDVYLPGFDNLVLAAGEWVDFDENGALIGGKLAEDAIYHHPVYGAIEFKAGARIEFNPDGTLKGGVLSRPLSIMNERYGKIDLIADEWFELHEGGEFKSGTLADELYIINTKAGNFYIVDGEEATFYEAQTLQYGILADRMELSTIAGNLQFEKSSEIELDEDDQILSGYVAKKYTIGGDDYRVGEWVDLVRYWPE